MSSPIYVHCLEGKAYWKPDSTGTEVELDVREVKLSPKTALAAFVPSKSAPYTRRATGAIDFTGTMQVYFRRDELPFATARNLQTGQRGTFRFPVDNEGNEWTGPAFIGEEITDTVFSDGDVKVVEIPFAADGAWTYPGA